MKHIVSRGLLVGIVAIQSNCKTIGTKKSDVTGYVSEGDSFLWPKGADGRVTVPVCWENPETSSDVVRSKVADFVTSEYSAAGINFVGWAPCTTDSAGIRILNQDTKKRYVEAFGAKLNGRKNGMVLNLNWDATPTFCDIKHKEICIMNDALHEFGHAIGLRHEANRKDSICVEAQRPGTGEQGALEVGEYDKDSIMNYCANMLVWKTGYLQRLSSMDREIISRYYNGQVSFANKLACENDGNTWSELLTESCCRLGSESSSPSEKKVYNYCGVIASVKLPDPRDKLAPLDLGSSKYTVIIDCPGLYPSPQAVIEKDRLGQEFPIIYRPQPGVLCGDVIVIPGEKKIGTKEQPVLRLRSQESHPISSNRLVFDGEYYVQDGSEVKTPTDILTTRFYSKHKFKLKSGAIWQSKSAILNCDKLDFYSDKISSNEVEFIISALGFQIENDISCTGMKLFDEAVSADSSRMYSVTFRNPITIILGKDSNQIDLANATGIEVRLK